MLSVRITFFIVFLEKLSINLQAHTYTSKHAHGAGHMRIVISSFWRWNKTHSYHFKKVAWNVTFCRMLDVWPIQNVNCRHWIDIVIFYYITNDTSPWCYKLKPLGYHSFIHSFTWFVFIRWEYTTKKVVLSLYDDGGWWHFTSISTKVNTMVMMSSRENQKRINTTYLLHWYLKWRKYP